MFSVVFFSLGFVYLYGSNLILHRIRRDYQNFGILRNSTAVLHVLIFALHLIFFLLSFKTTNWPFGWPSLTSYSWFWGFGFILVMGGGRILYVALKMFPSVDRILGRQVTILENQGIYRWSRNPQTVGYGMVLLGISLLWYTDYTLIAAILYAPTVHRLILIEEEHLERIFKDKYLSYCEETNRYFGRKPLVTKVVNEKYSMGNT